MGIGRTALFDEADRWLHRALTAYFHGRFARQPADIVSILFFSSRKDYDACGQERYAPSGGDFFGYYFRDPASRTDHHAHAGLTGHSETDGRQQGAHWCS